MGNIILGAESNKELLLLEKKIPSITLLILSDLGLENCTVNGVGDKQRGKWQIKGTDSQEKREEGRLPAGISREEHITSV